MRLALTILALCLATPARAGGGEPPAAPNFALATIDGPTFHLARHRGEVVVVLFGALDCSSCEKNDRLLRRYQFQYFDRGLTVVSVFERASLPAVARYDAPFLFRVWSGTDQGLIARRFGARALPTVIFIDREGYVRSVVRGVLGERDLVRLLQTLL